MARHKILLTCFFLNAATYLFAQNHERKITVNPGDKISISNDTNEQIFITGDGSVNAPVHVSGTGSHAILSGNSKIKISGSYIILENIWFKNITLTASDQAILIVGDDKKKAAHCRISNCNFFQDSSITNKIKDEQYFWIRMNGLLNNITNCSFEGKTNRLPVIHIDAKDFMNSGNIISNSIFKNVKPRVGDALEAIRIGLGNAYSGTKIINNKFFNYAGDPETISSKSNGNILEGNVFIGCRSGISLRLGDSSIIENNYFFKTRNAVRMAGSFHTIKNNVFYGLPVNRAQGGAIILMCGSGDENCVYASVHNINIQHNIFINSLNIRALKTNVACNIYPDAIAFSDNFLYKDSENIFRFNNDNISSKKFAELVNGSYTNGSTSYLTYDINEKLLSFSQIKDVNKITEIKEQVNNLENISKP